MQTGGALSMCYLLRGVPTNRIAFHSLHMRKGFPKKSPIHASLSLRLPLGPLRVSDEARLVRHRVVVVSLPAGENGRLLMCRETLDGHVEGTRSR
jgi:hypothetical protein